MSFQEQYEALMRRRNPNAGDRNSERSYTCLCCRDGGILPVDVVLRYLEDDETELMGYTATPIRCCRNGCKGGDTVIKTEEGEKEVEKYALYTTRNHLSPSECGQIHQWELERFRGEERSPQENAKVISEQVHQVVVQKAMQRVPVEVEPVDAPAPSFRIGDCVRFTAERFEGTSQRKQVIQELGEFFGSEGRIIHAEWVPMLSHYRYHIQVGDRVAKYTEVYFALAMEVSA